MSAPSEPRTDARKAHREGRYVSPQGVKGRTLDEESLSRPRKEGNQTSTGFERTLENSLRSRTEAIDQTVEGNRERPYHSGYLERDDDLSVGSRHAPEEAATTMTKEEKNDQGHVRQQQAHRDNHEMTLPERETGRQGISGQVQPPDVPSESDVFSKVRDVHSNMDRQDEAGQIGGRETPTGGVNNVEGASSLEIARGSGSGRQGQDHVSLKSASGSSWIGQVGAGAEGDREGEKKMFETEGLPSEFSEEDNMTVTNSLLYDDDFEDGGDDDYHFFTESERDDDSHPSSNLGEDSEPDEVNSNDVHVSVKRDGVNSNDGHASVKSDGVNSNDGHASDKPEGVNSNDGHASVKPDGVNSNDGHASIKPDRANSNDGQASVKSDEVDSVHEDDSVHEVDSVHEIEDSRTRGSKAVIIQRAWRRRAARKHQKELRRRRFELDYAVATRIHKVAQAYAEKWQESLLLQEKSARKLQACLTAKRVKREAQCRRTERNAAVRIQSAFRGKRARDKERELRREREARKIDTAMKIEALAREQTSQALLTENIVSAVRETGTPSSREEDREFEESASEIGEREGDKTELTERHSARAPVRGKSGSGLSPLEGHLSRSGSGRKEIGAESSMLDGLSTAVANATFPSLPTRLPSSTESSWPLPSAEFRSLSPVPPSQGRSGNEELSLGGDSSSPGASDRLIRDTRRPQQEEQNEGDAERGHEELDKSMVENEAYSSRRPVAVYHHEGVPQGGPNFVTKEQTEGGAERLSTTTNFDSGVDELPDDANYSTIQKPHDSDQKDIENVVSRRAERVTEGDILTVTTKTIAASTPEHGGRASEEASEYSSEDIKFDSLSSSSSSRRLTRTAEIVATKTSESKDAEESPKTEPMVITEAAQSAQVEETKEEFDDSSGSLFSFGVSDSSS